MSRREENEYERGYKSYKVCVVFSECGNHSDIEFHAFERSFSLELLGVLFAVTSALDSMVFYDESEFYVQVCKQHSDSNGENAPLLRGVHTAYNTRG